jgi:hypothetical protein
MELSTESKIVLITLTGIAALFLIAINNCQAQLSDKEIGAIIKYTNYNCTLMNDIEPSINGSMKKKILKILKSYNYTKEYQENTFDCSERSIITSKLLKDKGFDTKIAYRFSSMGAHVWCIVFDKWDNGIFIECCYTKNNELGKLVSGNSENFEYDSAWIINDPNRYYEYIEEPEIRINESNYRNYIKYKR